VKGKKNTVFKKRISLAAPKSEVTTEVGRRKKKCLD